jgi:hypothetical protein
VTILGLREPEPEPSMSGIRSHSASKRTRATEGSVASVCTSVIVVVGVAVEVDVTAEIEVVDAKVEVEPAMARDTWDFAGVLLLLEPVDADAEGGVYARAVLAIVVVVVVVEDMPAHCRARRRRMKEKEGGGGKEEGSMQNGTIYVTRFFHQPISGLGRYRRSTLTLTTCPCTYGHCTSAFCVFLSRVPRTMAQKGV